MKDSLLLTVFLLVSCSVGVISASSCEPNCSGKNNGDRVEDPMDCTRYYLCLGDGVAADASLPCDVGHHFEPDPPLGPDCVADTEDPPCSNLCVPAKCHLTCDSNNDYVANPYNCSSYFTCSPVGPDYAHPSTCPNEAPYFNGEVCVDSDLDCCSDLCFPYCHSASVHEIPDPKNCSSYYICTQEGPVDEMLHFQCPDGENFDVGRGHCIQGAPCLILCDEEITATISATTTAMTPATPTTAVPRCLNSLTCPQEGFFPACNFCSPDYFYCRSPGEVLLSTNTCAGNLLFNPVPGCSQCVRASDCPFTCKA